MTEQIEWEKLSVKEKKKQLFLNQKKLLETFLEKKAISQVQYEKCLSTLQNEMLKLKTEEKI